MAGWMMTILIISDVRLEDRGCRHIPTPGLCQRSGSIRQCQWAWAPSPRSTRHVLIVTFIIDVLMTRLNPKFGRSLVTAKLTNQRR